MYQVQFKQKHGELWVDDKVFADLKEALSYTCIEACEVESVRHQIVTVNRKGKTKILAKFKAMGLYL